MYDGKVPDVGQKGRSDKEKKRGVILPGNLPCARNLKRSGNLLREEY
jgi:hypothetical protein